jgi:DNA-directed RNA polymerase specialized sigma24 family protein
VTRRDDAEDLLHDAWVRMTERAAAVDNAEAFLVRSASNGGRDAYRRERREPPSSQVSELQIAGVRDDLPTAGRGADRPPPAGAATGRHRPAESHARARCS